MKKHSVQLYSVREAISRDLVGAITRLAEIGYRYVEPYDFPSRVDEYSSAFDAAGVTALSGHASVIDADDAENVFDAAKALGIGTVIDPFVSPERWNSVYEIQKTASRVNELQTLAASLGLSFGYHNHSWEFATIVEGRPAFDYFLDAVMDDVTLEIDTFWSTAAGADTPSVLRRLGERVKFLHVKDGLVSGDVLPDPIRDEGAVIGSPAIAFSLDNQVPAGSGDVGVVAILEAAPDAVRVVEFDRYRHDMFEGMAASLSWLRENDV